MDTDVRASVEPVSVPRPSSRDSLSKGIITQPFVSTFELYSGPVPSGYQDPRSDVPHLRRAVALAPVAKLVDETYAGVDTESERAEIERWQDREFQFFGMSGEATGRFLSGVAARGRDFTVPADPQASLAWYEITAGRQLPPETRALAIAALEAHQLERLTALSEIAEMVSSAYSDSTQAPSAERLAACYATDGQLWTFRFGDDARLDALVRRHLAAHADVVERARNIMGVR